MGQYTDEIGVWNRLGVINPSLDTWLKFPIISSSSYSTFRLQVNCEQPQKINSYILIRSRFTTASTNQVEQATRIYPRSHAQEKLIFQLPLNKELFDRSIFMRYIEIRKVYIRQKYIGITSDTVYTIELDELW